MSHLMFKKKTSLDPISELELREGDSYLTMAIPGMHNGSFGKDEYDTIIGF